MSTAQRSIREAAKEEFDPEDVRVGETLARYMELNFEMSPSGYLIQRPITCKELAANVRVGRRGECVSAQLISHLRNGRRHMSDELLFEIAKYLNVEPIQIKRPDAKVYQQRLPIAA